jgi:hypothetical protein
MSENSNIGFREVDKLKGLSNYYVWGLKIRAYLRGESQWTIIESEQKPVVFPTLIDGEQFTEVQLQKNKATACRAITMLVADDLVDLVAGYTDSALAWQALKD